MVSAHIVQECVRVCEQQAHTTPLHSKFPDLIDGNTNMHSG
jgi:hypothetical protein